MSEKVLSYIESNWEHCTNVNRKDEGTLIGLPYPYSIPAVGHFDEMYYWDTYFTNKGLELCGRNMQAKFNTDNMLYMVQRFGYMPNGNRTFYIGRSQPPFLSIMVRDVYDCYQDRAWLLGAYETLKKEYGFWTTQRSSEIGLSHYDHILNESQYAESVAGYIRRAGFQPEIPEAQLARHYYAVCESGWDLNPRWGYECFNFAQVELNSLLYAMEMNMAYFAEELHNGQETEWTRLAELRRQRMKSFMENEEGLFMDYNIVTKKQSSILSAAAFFPLYAGLAEQRHADALVGQLHRLEAEYGLLTCEKTDGKNVYQWDYPQGWSCLQYIAVIALDRYGYREEARRLAEKYVSLVDRVFEKSGNLWEKYNVVEGNINITAEGYTPPMMGWSAGTYLAALDYLRA